MRRYDTIMNIGTSSEFLAKQTLEKIAKNDAKSCQNSMKDSSLIYSIRVMQKGH